ncbi:MAG: hypothetical protein ABR552_00640 [Actinomycetota bacterium]|nr:hypothetical protein [Actinomycetota bacterium]
MATKTVRSSFAGGEAKRAMTATIAGAALGLVAALFARKEARPSRDARAPSDARAEPAKASRKGDR